MASARDRLNAYVTHESDEDAAEFERRVNASEMEARADALRGALRIIRENPSTAYDRILGEINLADRAARAIQAKPGDARKRRRNGMDPALILGIDKRT